jgi:type IV secretory pathway VirB2 component (pilin)
MNAAVKTFACLVACAVAGCNKSPQPSDGATVTTSALSQSKVLAPEQLQRAVPGAVAGQIGDYNTAPAVDAAAPAAPPSSPGNVDQFQGIDQSSTAPPMVIRTGQAFIEVEKIDPAILKIRQLAAQVGGYIASSSISGGHDQIRQATLELKMPSGRYDDALGSLASLGKVETVNSSAQDVGEEFVDVTARVTNSRRLEERLLSLLASRTGKLDDVLRVERELARVREEIERYEGRLRYLSAHVAMSTLSITVHEPGPLLGNSPGENPIAAAIRRAWKNFVSVVAGAIAALGVLIPLAVLAFAAWFGYRRWRRKISA